MASIVGRLLLSAAVLLAVLASAAALAPSYCAPGGPAVPRRPLLGCRWYVSSRTCGGAPLLPLPVLKERCCRELAAVLPECRCKALRSMMDDMSVSPGGGTDEQRQCWYRQAEFAATVVTERECALRTIHGANFCYDLGSEY